MEQNVKIGLLKRENALSTDVPVAAAVAAVATHTELVCRGDIGNWVVSTTAIPQPSLTEGAFFSRDPPGPFTSDHHMPTNLCTVYRGNVHLEQEVWGFPPLPLISALDQTTPRLLVGSEQHGWEPTAPRRPSAGQFNNNVIFKELFVDYPLWLRGFECNEILILLLEL